LLCLLDAFFGQVTLWVGRAFGVFAVNGDPMSNNVKLHDSLSTGR
jgi:hypothetical protein